MMERFGQLTLKGAEEADRRRWRMLCDCGTEKVMLASNVRRGLSTTCGGIAHRTKSLVGRKFGAWTVIEYARGSQFGGAMWSCSCECGAVKDVLAASLRNGASRSCGCKSREAATAAMTVDLTGRRFGRLVAQKLAGYTPGSGARWSCLCDCGRNKVVLSRNLVNGRTISCGCAVKDGAKIRPPEVRAKSTAIANTRRARLMGAGGSFTEDQIKDLFAKQRGRCACCRHPLKTGFHRDHRTPLSRGGSNDISNIELLCGPCNLRKNAKDEIAWAQENGRLL